MIKIEVGCGSRLPAGYIGVDIVKRVSDDKPFKEGEAAKLPFESGTVDKVSTSHMVEHLTPHYFVKALAEFSRVLRTGGKLVIRCPNADVYLRELIHFFNKGGIPSDEHYLKTRPYDIWPITNTTGVASAGDHMVNRNHFTLNHLKFYVRNYGGFKIKMAQVVQTRQNRGVEFREDGDLLVVGVKP